VQSFVECKVSVADGSVNINKMHIKGKNKSQNGIDKQHTTCFVREGEREGGR
jgi:hypothetical protein